MEEQQPQDAAAGQQLPPEFIEQVMALSPDQKRQLAEVLVASIQQEEQAGQQQQQPQGPPQGPPQGGAPPQQMMRKGGKVGSFRDFHSKMFGKSATKSMDSIETNKKNKK